MSYRNNIINVIKELSKGMDLMSENLCLLNVNYEKSEDNLNIYQISNHFLTKFDKYKNIKDGEDINTEELLKEFTFISHDTSNLKPSELENLTKIAKVVNSSLYHDITKFYFSSKNNISNNNSDKTYQTAVYIAKTNDELNKYCYFEVKYITILNLNISSKPILLLLFKDIEYEKFSIKSQQMNTFSNILVSSLTHELNNPLNGLNGLIFSIKNDIDKIKSYLNLFQRNLEENKTNKETSFNFIESIKEHINSIKIFIDFAKYSHQKIDLVGKNFTFYSKFKLKLPMTFKLHDSTINKILKKSLKLFKTLARINKIKIAFDVEILNYYIVKTDKDFLEIILSNIVLMAEKHCKETNISIFVTDIDDKIINTIKHLDSIKIKFILEDMIIYSNAKLDDALNSENLDIINIFNFTNNCLAENINCKYTEKINNDKILTIELLLKSVYTLFAN